MDIAILGSGAVGGYFGAKLAQAGERVTFLDVGEHLRAIRESGLTVTGPLGTLTVRAVAEEDPAVVGQVDLVVLGVKTYDNDAVLPKLLPLVGRATAVLTLQNGVDSVDQVAGVVGEESVLGGAAYLATALVAPGMIEQTGTIRRIVFGEVFGGRTTISQRVQRVTDVLRAADIQAEPVADARVPIWQKFVYLSAMAGLATAARLPVGPLWADEEFGVVFRQALAETEAVARAEGVPLPPDVRHQILHYVDTAVSPAMRPSLLIDLEAGKRLEVEALVGAVVRRGRTAGIATPVMATLYAVLRPHAAGRAVGERAMATQR